MKLRFGGFVLDQEAGCLTGPEGEVRLRPQAFRMLEVLAEQAPKILSQEELLDRVWGVEHLSPASVKQAVSEVRQALGDDPARPGIIETEIHASGGQPDRVARIGPTVPMGRAGRAEEVADAVLWLLGDGAGYCTGTVLDVAGGR